VSIALLADMSGGTNDALGQVEDLIGEWRKALVDSV